MKIEHIRIYRVRPEHDAWVWAAIETDEGYVGWGEASSSEQDETVAEIIAQLRSSLIGKDPRHLIKNTTALYDWRFSSLETNRFVKTAWSSIDQALWDISSQSFNMPLYCLLGAYGQEKAIPLYANLNRGLRHDRTPEALACRGTSALEAGFDIVKCTPFDELSPLTDSVTLTPALERIEALSSVLSLSRIAIDCHQRFHRTSLCRFLDQFLSTDLPYWIEDPMVFDQVSSFSEIRNKFPGIRWAGGETSLGLDDMLSLVNPPLVDVFMPDVKHVGGVSVLKTMIPFAEHHGVWVSLHNPTSPIATAFSAHLSALRRNIIPLEFPWGVVSKRAEATIPSEPVSRGKYILSERPGVGIQPCKDFLKEYGEEWQKGEWRGVTPH